MKKEDVKFLLEHFKPSCHICCCYHGPGEPTVPATRQVNIPDPDYPYPKPYPLCDECDFTMVRKGDRQDWEERIGQKLPEPSEFEDTPWADIIRRCQEYVKE
jgi:hypothetical protein